MIPNEVKQERRVVRLTKPQHALVTSKAQFPAFVGGFGSGKTEALMNRALAKKLQYPKLNIAYYLPTFDLARTIGFPRLCEKLEDLRIPFLLNKTYATIEIGKGAMGNVLFRTMDNPERIVGYEVADSFVDELDTLKMDDARMVWNKIISRNRQKKHDGELNTVAVGTTPEGYRFVYERWARNEEASRKDGYELIKASTVSNARNLPKGYIESLRATYPSNLLSAYLDGEFVNLVSGSVYPQFDRVLNRTSAVVRAGEPLHIGMDFNVGNMAAVVYVVRDGKAHAVKEFVGLMDTPAMVQALKGNYPGHMIIVYPDSSGKSRRSNDASISDISLLRQARFNVIVNTQNPAVKDRVLSMNKMIEARNLLVNVDECPLFTESLEKQAYNKNGEPDKTSGFDHLNDAGGYAIVQKWPIRSTGMKRLQLAGT
jgi:phage terminase large subunit-like protein